MMKKTVCTFLGSLLLAFSFAQNTAQPDKILGKFTLDALRQPPYDVWYDQGFSAYELDAALTKALKKGLKGYDIKVFMGTWCGDSRRELPGFSKIMETIGFPDDRITYVGVDNGKETYKQSPTGEEKGLNIHRVPTFIFYKDGVEKGRIVEYPVVSLEADMLKIVSGDSYTPNYHSVGYLDGVLKNNNGAQLQNEAMVLKELEQRVEDKYDLNTYGYVLLYAGDKEKAQTVFELNSKLFPKESYPMYSLGRCYEESGNIKAAKDAYQTALVLYETHTQKTRLLERIKKLEEEN